MEGRDWDLNPSARLHRQEPPPGSCYLLEPKLVEDFKTFLAIDLRLNCITVQGHIFQVKRFQRWLIKNRVNEVSRDVLRSYLREYADSSAFTYSNVVKSLRRLFRDFLGMPDLVGTFRLPKKPLVPKSIPSRSDLQKFYEALDSKIGKALFLVYASSGLRKREVLSLKRSDVDFSKRMIVPNCHDGETKHSYLSFFNEETEKALREYLSARKDDNAKLFRIGSHPFLDLWKRAYVKAKVRVTPQVLREWFCSEMVAKGVSDGYVDAFCGRIPRSILARHYLDYSQEKLKTIYDKADLRVLK